MSTATKSALPLLIATAVVFTSRLPFIGTGYGSDPDSYRLAIVARTIAETGRYTASRMPGYPVPELALSRVIHLGPIATNLISAALSAVAFLCLALILRRWKVPDALLVSLAFAFTPVVYVNSTCTMDYIWAFAFILISLAMVVNGRMLLGGASIGLAAGCRLSSAAMALPILVYWYLDHERSQRRWRGAVLFLGAAAGFGLLCFLPVIDRYGLGFLSFAGDYPRLVRVLANLSTRIWGVIGCLALFVLVPYLGKGIHAVGRSVRNPAEAPIVLFSITAILVYGALFVRLPNEAGYLIPIVPWVLVLLTRILPSRPLRVVLGLLILSPFVLAVDKGGIRWYGPIFLDHENRAALATEAEGILSSARQLEEKSLVVAGYQWPLLRLRLGADREGEARFVESIHDVEEYAAYAKQGYRVYYLRDMDRYMKRAYGLDLNALGAQVLRPVSVPGEVPR